MGGLTSRPSRPEPIGPAHDTASFASGVAALDRWLKERALRSEGRTARTYVTTVGMRVVGYYCLATGSATRAAVGGNLRRNAPDPVPLMLLGRLAVDAAHQGAGIGGGLLKDALQRILGAAAIVGTRAVLVHATDDSAAAFYRRYGFIPYPPAARTLFLPIETIADVLG